MTPKTRLTFLLLALFTLFTASDALAQGRKRPVRRLSGIYLTGVVLDAATSAPVFDATVTVQGKTVTANKNGQFTVSGLTPGSTTIKGERWGYETATQPVSIASGPNTFTLRLTGKSTTKVTLLDGAVHILDHETSAFKSLQPFVGYTPMAEPIQLCNSMVISRSELRSIADPTAGPLTTCCTNGNVTTARFTRTNGTSFNASFKDCYYYSIHFGGLDRTTGKEVIFPLSKIKSIEFP
ncbi:MAG: carboxypeptidase regulatory-like domain-containing protein [Thermoanaerobaculia bacterium]